MARQLQATTQTTMANIDNRSNTSLRLIFGTLMVLAIPYVYVTIKAASDVSLDKMTGVDSPRVLKSLLEHASRNSAVATANVAPACDNFFTVLASAWIPNEGNCSDVYDKYRDLILEHEASMQRMGKKLTIFTTWTDQELQQGCGDLANFGFTVSSNHIQLQQFDPEALLLKHGFTATHVEWMKKWQIVAPRFHHAVTRLSDVFRIALQREHAMAYADLDVVYLLDDPRVYTAVPNVAVPIWSEEKGAFEIQNSAFCFSREQLDVLLNNIRTLMDSVGEKQTTQNSYIYTQFGPNLFQHSIQSMQILGPIQLYYTHSDDHWQPERVAELSKAYGGFVWLHLGKYVAGLMDT
jgi:hypothetical protein